VWEGNRIVGGCPYYGIHHEVRAIGYTNSIIVGKEVVAKFVSKCVCKVAGNKTSDRRRDSEGS